MHNIRYERYENSVSRKKVQKSWDLYVAEEDYQEGACGLPNPIRWIETPVLKNYDEARKYIEDHDRNWYDCLAVRYKEGRKMFWLVKVEYHT